MDHIFLFFRSQRHMASLSSNFPFELISQFGPASSETYTSYFKHFAGDRLLL